MGLAGRQPSRYCHRQRQRSLTSRNQETRDPVTSHPSPSQTGSRAASSPPRAGRNFFDQVLNASHLPTKSGQAAFHRTAQADFNVRGWQGCGRLVLLMPAPRSAAAPVDPVNPTPAGSTVGSHRPRPGPGRPSLPRGLGRNFFGPFVNWITFAGKEPSQSEAYRAARADFNVRGWQGRWRYTASTALFFAVRPVPTPPPSAADLSGILAGA
jgi:hypothetical protein